MERARRSAGSEHLAAAAVLVTLVAFALIRIQVTDVPWHLATARLAHATGHWPTRNTFSYTFPDYPLYQQYPAFQAVLYAVYRVAGWEGLSVLLCAGWSAVFLLFVRWAGPWRAALPLHVAWMVGLYALQRRMILRPDLFTMLALGATLLALDAYEQGRRRAIFLIPVIHLLWVNSHQLFPLSLVVQALFVGHLALKRAAPLGPPLAALGVSAALCLATPLGVGILKVAGHTTGSLIFMRDQVGEFSPIWRNPYELALFLASGAPAAWALWRGRRVLSPFDTGLWLMSVALALSAVRGLMFSGIVSIAVLQRTARRTAAAGLPLLPPLRPTSARILRAWSVIVTLVLAANVVGHRWVRPPLALGGTQPGLGRSLGGWADAAIDFLRASPPPGRMMNMAWTSGNALIWGLPDQPVFVDPRFESYPRPFLREAVDAYRDDAALAALIDRYRPTWIFAEHFRDAIRARVAALVGHGWTPVYADSDHLILVRDLPETAAYRAAHVLDLGRPWPGDLLPGPPELRAQQLARFARLRQALGLDAGSARSEDR